MVGLVIGADHVVVAVTKLVASVAGQGWGAQTEAYESCCNEGGAGHFEFSSLTYECGSTAL